MWTVVAILTIVQSIFSLWPVLIKMVLQEGISSLLIAVVRDTLASSILWVWVWIETGRPDIWRLWSYLVVPSKLLDLTDRNLFLYLGVFSSLNSLGYIFALEYVTPFNSALLHPTIPVFAAFLGSLYGVEKLTSRKIVGAVICIIGSLVVVMSQADMSVSSSLLGNILLLVQSFAMAALLVGQKFVPSKYSSLKTTAIYYTIGTCLTLPVCIFRLAYSDEFAYLTKRAVLVICYGAIFVVAFNYAAMTWANKVSSPAIPASSMMLQPPLTYGLAYLLQGKQQPGVWELGGAVAIVFGLILTTVPSCSGGAGHGQGTGDESEEGAMMISKNSSTTSDDDDDCEASTGLRDTTALLVRHSNISSSSNSDTYQHQSPPPSPPAHYSRGGHRDFGSLSTTTTGSITGESSNMQLLASVHSSHSQSHSEQKVKKSSAFSRATAPSSYYSSPGPTNRSPVLRGRAGTAENLLEGGSPTGATEGPLYVSVLGANKRLNTYSYSSASNSPNSSRCSTPE